MKRKKVNQIQKKINQLTKDEDERQELWTYYLNGNPESTFSDHLKKISEYNSQPDKIRVAVHDLIHNPPSIELVEIISGFTDLEKSFICMMLLGLSVVEIADYKDMRQIVVNSIIRTIKLSPRWDKLWKIKKGGINGTEKSV